MSENPYRADLGYKPRSQDNFVKRRTFPSAPQPSPLLQEYMDELVKRDKEKKTNGE